MDYEKEKEWLQNNSPAALPLDASESGWTAQEIKDLFVKPLERLLELLRDAHKEYGDNDIEEKANISALQDDVKKIKNGTTVVGKANADKDGNEITGKYETIANVKSKDDAVNLKVSKIEDGRTVVEKAKKDEGGNVIRDTYGNTMSLSRTLNENNVTISYELRNKNNAVLSSGTVVIPLVDKDANKAGLLSVSDKTKLDGLSQTIASAISSNNTEKFTANNLKEIIQNAGTSSNGLMSAEDKRRLDVIYSYLGENGDTNNFVDKVTELLQIFENYAEGQDIAQMFNSKVNVSDIKDNLTSSDANKPLSAKQGKELKTQVDTKATATLTVLDSDVIRNEQGYVRAIKIGETEYPVSENVDVKAQPNIATQVADFIDQNKIYLYVGNESGYSKGYIYYYNGNDFVLGTQYLQNVEQLLFKRDIAIQTPTTEYSWKLKVVNGKPRLEYEEL